MNAVVYNRHFDFNDLAKFCKKKKQQKLFNSVSECAKICGVVFNKF